MHDQPPEPDGQPSGSWPTVAVQVGNSLYFYAEDAEHGRELWSVHPGMGFYLYAERVPIWEDKRKWIMAPGLSEAVLATYLVLGNKTPLLVARNSIRLSIEPQQADFSSSANRSNHRSVAGRVRTSFSCVRLAYGQ